MTKTPHTPEQRCCKTIWGPRVNSWNCTRNASVFEDGKPYCKQHAPSSQAARDKKASDEYEAKKAVQNKARDRIDQCVRACAGIPDPEATLKSVREALEEIERLDRHCGAYGTANIAKRALALLPAPTEAP